MSALIHPGTKLRLQTLPALGVTVTAAAKQLGIQRVGLSCILHGHTAITCEMARRLAIWLSNTQGNTASDWLSLQLECDLWVAARKPVPNVTTFQTSQTSLNQGALMRA